MEGCCVEIQVVSVPDEEDNRDVAVNLSITNTITTNGVTMYKFSSFVLHSSVPLHSQPQA